jgi:hypothetical protein
VAFVASPAALRKRVLVLALLAILLLSAEEEIWVERRVADEVELSESADKPRAREPRREPEDCSGPGQMIRNFY